MSNKFTDEYWEVFRLYSQDRLGYKVTAEQMGLPVWKVRKIISQMRKIEPGLFPAEKEYLHLGRHNRVKLLSWNTLNEEEPIKDRF